MSGTGYIRQRKDQRWEAMISLGTDAQGKRIRRSIYGETRLEVTRKLEKVIAKLKAGDPPQ